MEDFNDESFNDNPIYMFRFVLACIVVLLVALIAIGIYHKEDVLFLLESL